MTDSRSLDQLIQKAREMSWERFGKKITFYVPGMFVCNGVKGKYPAVSITGSECELQCEHCKGNLLEPMIPALNPDELIQRCLRLDQKGAVGCLISGGSTRDGRLPWSEFAPAIAEIKKQTDLKVSVHTGYLDKSEASALKQAGVDQALIDVIGDEDTLKEIFHLDIGLERVEETLAALFGAGLSVVPHIITGVYYGEIRGEMRALEMIAQYTPELLVYIVMMPLTRTPLFKLLNKLDKPAPQEVAEIIARGRLAMPGTIMSLGCARPRNKRGELIEQYALDCGINRMALYSDEVVQQAQDYGLEITYEKSCCSV